MCRTVLLRGTRHAVHAITTANVQCCAVRKHLFRPPSPMASTALTACLNSVPWTTQAGQTAYAVFRSTPGGFLSAGWPMLDLLKLGGLV
jgi:hypothetical protein